MLQLRKHQSDFQQVIDGIIAGSGVTDIFCHVVPGGGKSLLPLQAGKLIVAGLAEKIAWICPRMTLQDQGERNFLTPEFRQMLGYALTIRSATNDALPTRGTDGLITTYQALAVDRNNTVVSDFERHPYILVLDEFQHLEEQGEWTRPVQALYNRAVLRVFLSGTPSRGDQKRVAFMPYRAIGADEFAPCFEGQEKTVLIKYGRKEALRDRAVIPMEFHFAEGVAKWESKTGKIIERKISARTDANHALYTALNTEYARELLLSCVDHWKGHRVLRNPNATLLVVAANIEAAKQYTGILKRQGLQAEIATSDDTESALRHMNALKAGKLRIMVSVAMISEGFDCPSVSHIAYLTNYRTGEWAEQCFSRAVRIDPQAGPYEAQQAHIFAPNDPMMLEIARKIEAEQQAVAVCRQTKERFACAGEPMPGERQAPGGITPLSSRLVTSVTSLTQSDFFREETKPLVYETIHTNRETETDLLRQIESHVRQYSFQNRIVPGRLNGEIFNEFGKKRRNMTIPELEKVLAWVKTRYPMTVIRGTGRLRVGSKARPLMVEWR